jgi:hypothetical protein
VAVESTLNTAWALLGFLAIAAAVGTAHVRSHAVRSRRLQVLCVALVVAALFPYISSTDDALRLQCLASQQQGNTNESRSHDNLMRLYEAMDSPVAAQLHEFAICLFTFAFVVLPVLSALDRTAPRVVGRSPPVFA